MQYDDKRQKTRVKRITKNIQQNNGIINKNTIENEKQLKQTIQTWLKDKTLYRKGTRNETKQTKKWRKKEQSKITKVETEINRGKGRGDIAIHHNGLHLSWNHMLGNPFIIELKNGSFRDAASQSIRYKEQSAEKYQEKGKYKILQTGIATTKSLSTGNITGRDKETNPYPANFEAKRIYWKLGVGVVQSINPDELIISFNEGDIVLIQ